MKIKWILLKNTINNLNNQISSLSTNNVKIEELENNKAEIEIKYKSEINELTTLITELNKEVKKLKNCNKDLENQYKNKITELDNQITQLQNSNTHLKANHKRETSELNLKINETKNNNIELEKNYKQEIENLNKKISDLNNEIQQLQKKHKTESTELNQKIIDLYKERHLFENDYYEEHEKLLKIERKNKELTTVLDKMKYNYQNLIQSENINFTLKQRKIRNLNKIKNEIIENNNSTECCSQMNNNLKIKFNSKNFVIIKSYQIKNTNLKWYLFKKVEQNSKIKKYSRPHYNTNIINTEPNEINYNDYIWKPVLSNNEYDDFKECLEKSNNDININDNDLAIKLKETEEKLEAKEKEFNRINIIYGKLVNKKKNPDNNNLDKLIENNESMKNEINNLNDVISKLKKERSIFELSIIDEDIDNSQFLEENNVSFTEVLKDLNKNGGNDKNENKNNLDRGFKYNNKREKKEYEKSTFGRRSYYKFKREKENEKDNNVKWIRYLI